MIKVIEVTFYCEEEFNALDVVNDVVDAHMLQPAMVSAPVEHWHVEEYTEEAKMNRDKISLMSAMARLTQALDAFREAGGRPGGST